MELLHTLPFHTYHSFLHVYQGLCDSCERHNIIQHFSHVIFLIPHLMNHKNNKLLQLTPEVVGCYFLLNTAEHTCTFIVAKKKVITGALFLMNCF